MNAHRRQRRHGRLDHLTTHAIDDLVCRDIAEMLNDSMYGTPTTQRQRFERRIQAWRCASGYAQWREKETS